jgi:hypothetical protein
MNKILCKVSDEDAKKLYDTIVEVEACHDLHEEAKKKLDCTPMAFKVQMDYYMHTLKVHKTFWMELAVKYLGEDVKDFNSLRYDPVKKAIFRLEGCSECKK